MLIDAVPAAPDLDVRDGDGKTVLIHQVMMGNTDLVRRLLARGASVGLKDHWGGTALTWAERTKRKEIAQMLREAEEKSSSEKAVKFGNGHS